MRKTKLELEILTQRMFDGNLTGLISKKLQKPILEGLPFSGVSCPAVPMLRTNALPPYTSVWIRVFKAALSL